MPLDALAGAYAGLTCLALATRRPRQAIALPSAATPPRLRLLGAFLLGLALALLAAQLGTALGIVAWIGIVGIAALALVLLLSRSTRAALLAVPPLLLLGAAALLFG